MTARCTQEMLRSLKADVPNYVNNLKKIKKTRKDGEVSTIKQINTLISDRCKLARSGNFQQLQQSLQNTVELNDRAENLLNQLINAKNSLTLFISRCELMNQRIHAMLEDRNALITQFYTSWGHGDVTNQFALVFSCCENEMNKCLNSMKSYQCLTKAVESAVKKVYDEVKQYHYFEDRYQIITNLSDAIYIYENVLNHYESGINVLKVNILGMESVINQIASICGVC